MSEPNNKSQHQLAPKLRAASNTMVSSPASEQYYTPKSEKSASSILRGFLDERGVGPAGDTTPQLELNSTFDSDDESSINSASPDCGRLDPKEIGSNESFGRILFNGGDDEQDSKPEKVMTKNGASSDAATLLFIALFASFGYMARMFIDRLFGADCSDGMDAPEDFLAPLFSKICVTNSGTTDQTGGALFIDLPANMIGCFIMGMISHPMSSDCPLPWFRRDHPLQKNKALHVGISTGFCGCLTTFASWNSQMVQMMDGTDTELGPQVIPALFGYVIGLCGSFSSYIMGRQAHELLKSMHPRPVVGDTDEESPDEESGDNDVATSPLSKDAGGLSARQPVESAPCARRIFNVDTIPIMAFACLLGLFLLGGIGYNILFYQQLVLASCFAPVGAILRWKLSGVNAREGPWSPLRWVPWGTLTANLVASLVSVAIAAIQIRYLADYDTPWVSVLLPAVKTGLAGSLSTVSTMIKEMLTIERPDRSFRYAVGSLMSAMLLGLVVFSPIARS